MSLSKAQRLEQMELALELMYGVIGDDRHLATEFLAADEAFKRIPPTTWKDLEHRGLVKIRHLAGGGLRIRLEPLGWLAALSSTGGLQDQDFQHRLGVLSATLKSKVDRHAQEQLIGLDLVAQQTKLPAGWIYNMIACHFWQNARGQHGAELDPKAIPTMIWIDHRFGLEIL